MCSPGPATAPGSFLEMQIWGSHLKPTESEILGVTSSLGFDRPPPEVFLMPRFERHSLGKDTSQQERTRGSQGLDWPVML